MNNPLLFNSIIADVTNRKIEYLVHFTDINNLPGILSNGILSIDNLNSQNLSYTNNDDLRLDGYANSISLSVSFPNYSMLSKYRIYADNPKDMAIIFLDPSILWTLDCAFFYTNAANGLFNHISLQTLKTYPAWQTLFDSNVRGIDRSSLNIPKEFTTDPQAEVLCFNPIPTDKIKYILFDNPSTFQKIGRKLPNINDKYYHETEPFYFAPRSDYQSWKKS
ncbi:DarT ssDNA thymidine ADP-ribosyltransferase family protein [Lysinibacillus sp. fls2-241-R2A-57]|uniref:DarT ssDNA thymidine ADP-ribosyltransferase family protein n=1 Tax=Lysinibacillus sp. fls2-241-R2A-57 TaxID=3040292 RepID=UPI00255714EF|nr:DarT ssDNA thymidine ADP-ribosyltransferase family protein [Lysinibacillus sp. fls2-241-R2A-57]